MANPEHLKILEQGVVAWNQWRKDNPIENPDLSDEDLRGAYLSGANLYGARLHGSDLRGADLRGAILTWAKIGGANLGGADLRGAELSGTDLGGAELPGVNLDGAKLNGAFLSGSNLRGAHLNSAYLSGADLRQTDLSGANLQGSILESAILVGTNLEKADLTHCYVHGISAWDLNLQGASQLNLVITPFDQPTITVDNLEVAQFIYLLLNNAKLRDVIDTVTSKAVLILGRFTPERKAILDAIREKLRQRNYLPILFDFDKPSNRDLTETVRTLAQLSRFIIADITEPRSISHELQAIVPDLAVPVQPLLLQGSTGEYAMFPDLRRKYQWVLAIYEYTDLQDLVSNLDHKVIAPAEAKLEELRRL